MDVVLQSSLLESSNVLISGGNLIKKVLFPAEVLPIVTVLANMVHFLLRAADPGWRFSSTFAHPLNLTDLLWFPVVVVTQLLLTIGLALIVSALTVHFRDLKDLLANLHDALVLRDADHLPDDDGARRRQG